VQLFEDKERLLEKMKKMQSEIDELKNKNNELEREIED
jgi:cell division protein FtsB